MNVLTCLLSGQHVPNLLSVHHFRPDRLVLIQTKGMEHQNAADNFKTALQLGDLNYDDRCHIESLDTEDDIARVREALSRAYGKFPEAHWIANITGGTKPMSIAAYEFFKAIGGDVVYTNFSAPNEVIHLISGRKEQIDHRLKVKEFLAGYGFELRKNEQKVRDAENRASKWGQCATAIARHMASDNLLVLTDTDRNTARSKGWTIRGSELNVSSGEVRAELRNAFTTLQESGEQCLTGKVDKYEVDFLTGGWLEVFIWNLLKKHQDALGIWDVHLGLQIGQIDVQTDNECDVCFMRNSGLSIVECKSGTQEHDAGGDVLYKLEAVVRQFRALHVKSHLVTTGTNMLDNRGMVKPAFRNRAEIYRCGLLLASDVRELADESVTAETVAKKFFR